MALRVKTVIRNFWNSKFQISLAILFLQIYAVFELLIIMDLASPEISAINPSVLMVFDSVVSLLVAVLNSRFMYFFLSRNKFYAYVFLMIVGLVLSGLMGELPLTNVYSDGLLTLIIIGMTLSYIPPMTAMVYILMDSLRSKDDKVYRLIGAANLFILFPIVFGGVLVSLELVRPLVIGADFTTIVDAMYFYTKLSFYGATGFEAPVQGMSELLNNALTMESFFMDLFALLMLGRLVEK